MKLIVTISMPIDAVDEQDAKECCIDVLARAIAKGVSQKGAREWLMDHATVEVREG